MGRASTRQNDVRHPDISAVRPVRAISRTDLTLAVVNGVTGSAIFGMPAQIAALTGSESPLAHVLAVAFCAYMLSTRSLQQAGTIGGTMLLGHLLMRASGAVRG